MRRLIRIGVAVVMGTAAAAGVSSTALAHQSIKYHWNSDDQDVRANFVANGDNIHAYEKHGTTYVQYYYANSGTLRWYVPGDDTNTRRTLNESMPEGKNVGIMPCQHHSAWPADCSGYWLGVS